jgi:hypothetical protein
MGAAGDYAHRYLGRGSATTSVRSFVTALLACRESRSLQPADLR